jgi:hypothetical protein
LALAEIVGREETMANSCRYIAKALARQNRAAEGLPYALRAVEIFTRLKIDPESMDKAQATLRECEAGVTKISEL